MSNSRDKILATVKVNQPEQRELPGLPLGVVGGDLSGAFVAMLETIGGSAYLVSGYERIATILREQYPRVGRIISGCPELAVFAETGERYADPHVLEDVGLAVLKAHFGVAENGACWITEDQMIERALPFIAQHLALIIRCQDIVADMHGAYEWIEKYEAAAPGGEGAGVAGEEAGGAVVSGGGAGGAVATGGEAGGEGVSGGAEVEAAVTGAASYGFATFIAGPSKTADIEQSLVLGAHGPRSLIVFLIDEGLSDAGFY
jgi:L-lactate dehydrogenase complex protein LldG